MTDYLYNDFCLKTRRRELRKNQTDAEKVLWRYLRRRTMEDLKFFRQYGVGPYTIDFYCPQIRLAIEIDGGQHAESQGQAKDTIRTKYLEKENIRVVRFWNNEVIKQKEAVIEKIRQFAAALKK
ncbi:endonuclease domain-containing protein [Patescibacteria group bacterium]|nr:endonuclease domain-containing protein [Patescibacteria group bacterium]